MELIDKAIIVAEILERIKKLTKEFQESETIQFSKIGQIYALENLNYFLDTIKSKEVELDKEIDKWYNNEASKEFENIFYEDIEKCAKYFFELGLKTRKE